jgi:UDP-4-amino-4-deoxy-L-arabinose-oxoglutarate aminotransferase
MPTRPRRTRRRELLPLCRPQISEEEISAVAGVLRSGWITTGAKTAELEERFREHVGAPGAVALSSATAGMHLVLRALGVGPGDEVVTPSWTWVSTVNLIVLAGATPVFADVDRDTLVVTASSIERCLTSRTRVILPVHFAGGAVDLESMRVLARACGAAVVEDAAHATSTFFREERIGRRGTSIFSFHPIKNMTTGEGGMVCSDDERLLAAVRRGRFHGLGADAWDRATQGRKARAEVLEPGFKYNPTDVASVLGLGQLARLDERTEMRRILAREYDERLARLPAIRPIGVPPDTTRHSWSLYVVRLDTDETGLERDELIDRLQRENIGAGLHFHPAHRHEYYRKHPALWRGDLPNTDWNAERALSLPLFPGMGITGVHDVVDVLEEVIAR